MFHFCCHLVKEDSGLGDSFDKWGQEMAVVDPQRPKRLPVKVNISGDRWRGEGSLY